MVFGHRPTPLNSQSTVGSLSRKYRKPNSVEHHALIDFIKKPFLGNTENQIPVLYSINAYLT
eukprot:9495706-Ditylum_brightwellii.AAC.1